MGEIGAEEIGSFSLHTLENLLDDDRRIGHRCNADGRQSPRRLRVDLSHGDVEAVTQPLLERAQHLAAVFKGPGLVNAQLQSQQTDNGHGLGELEFLGHFGATEKLDDIALLDVVVVLERHAAFLTGSYLGDVVLEAL